MQSHCSMLALEDVGFSQGLVPSWSSSHFNIMIDSKLCIIRLHFWFVLLLGYILWNKNSIFEKKGQRIGGNPSKNTYIAIEKLEMRRHSAFFLFKICIWWSVDSKFNEIRKFVCRGTFAFAFFQNLDFTWLKEAGVCSMLFDNVEGEDW